ncbi:hypothetical protein ACSBL2_03085 [Pedobacter sp. AW31-3R]|uniref:hypothetical protein n=1 Tax=Pedobacter sp. AW31-3R TaxID=3445781 RepID=UPI003FA144BC
MKKYQIGIAAFLLVLFSMPLGHAAMIIMEKTLDHRYLFSGALLMGLAGVIMTIIGIYAKKDVTSTLMGLIGSLLVWTGWVEFCYVYYAQRYHINPLIENGEVVTKPEYLLMPSSIGMLAMVLLHYTFGKRSGCTFFGAIQKFLKVDRKQLGPADKRGNSSIVTFMEMNVLLWSSYLLLLLTYDNNFLGDRHPVTYMIAFGSLLWSAWLFIRLIKIQKIGYAIRYAIPVVIIFWTFVEIVGRWGLFKEIWVHPFDYMLEMGLMLAVLIILTITLLFSKRNVTPKLLGSDK